MKKSQQTFGGDWTNDKLEKIHQYLKAYTTALKSQPFETNYIDAFAGTGYMASEEKSPEEAPLFPELAAQESQKFLKGSAKIALEVEPRFKKYIFIEKDAKRFTELEKLREEFPEKKNDIQLVQADANDFLLDFCVKSNWSKKRAVLFLDPFGMQVEWKTVETVAQTKAIDLWYLFPLGGVGRLLTNDGKIDPIWEKKLNEVFGNSDWREAFYGHEQTIDLFLNDPKAQRTVDFSGIERYFINRLKSIFPGVAPNPLKLLNSKNIPLFLLCFACGNEKGAPLALKIANHILKG